jgi:hypothetical protein
MNMKIEFGSPLVNPHEGEGNRNFLRSTTTLMTPRQPSPSRGQIPKSNENIKIIDEVL